MSNHPTLAQKLERVRRILSEAGEAGAAVAETTPKQGGLRARDVQILVDAGEAEWIVEGERARLKSATSGFLGPDHLMAG